MSILAFVAQSVEKIHPVRGYLQNRLCHHALWVVVQLLELCVGLWFQFRLLTTFDVLSAVGASKPGTLMPACAKTFPT